VGTCTSVSHRAGDVVKSLFFSGVVTLLNSIDDYVKGCHIRGMLAGNVRVTYMDWRKKCTCCVYQVSHAGCTSIQIVVTLEYE
jgi:hypothetical protein